MSNIIFKTLLLKGEAGNNIQSIEKTATSGLVDTYTITLTDGSTTTFEVTNGKSIVSIEKTSSVGYVDTYTITYNDGTTDTFEITLATITVDDALSDSSTNPVENRVVTNALNTKSNNSNLATVESGTTASQAYTVGDYLVYNGQLCKVISAIAQGDTLTVGTNIEATTSGGEFKKINSDLTVGVVPEDITVIFGSSAFTNKRAFCKKIGKMIFYNISFTTGNVTFPTSTPFALLEHPSSDLPADTSQTTKIQRGVLLHGTSSSIVNVAEFTGDDRIAIYPETTLQANENVYAFGFIMLK